MGALGFLVANSMRAGAVESIPVGKLVQERTAGQSFVGKRLRVVGFVGAEKPQSTPVQTPDGTINQIKFTVVEGKDSLPVTYTDVLPDTFRAGGPVQVDGVYTSSGSIRAEHVLTKCPSKYQAEEKANADKQKALLKEKALKS